MGTGASPGSSPAPGLGSGVSSELLILSQVWETPGLEFGREASSGLAASSLPLHPLLSKKFPAWNWVPTEAHPVLISWPDPSQIPHLGSQAQ